MSKANVEQVDLSEKQASQCEKNPEETPEEKRCRKIARLLIELAGTICPGKRTKAKNPGTKKSPETI